MESILDLLPVILVALILWLSGITFTLWLIFNHYRKLTKGTHRGNLLKVLDAILDAEKENKKNIGELTKTVGEINKKSRFFVQKIGLLRFNPFSEIGGDQSFSLSVLDEEESGFVMTGLHTRDRTRVYAKPIEKGKSKYELSAEERKAVRLASKKK